MGGYCQLPARPQRLSFFPTMSPPSQQIDKRIPYEQRVDEKTVLRLHELCTNCTRVVRASRTLLELGNGSVYRGAVETVPFGTPNDLKSGYLSDCHLCAKLWSLANGCLLDPDDAKITVDKISLSFEGRNPPRQNRWRALVSQVQTWWNGPTPEPLYVTYPTLIHDYPQAHLRMCLKP